MSVPTAVTGWMPNTRIRSGVISEPPPMPVMPMSMPMPKPNTTMTGSIVLGVLGLGCGRREAGYWEPGFRAFLTGLVRRPDPNRVVGQRPTVAIPLSATELPGRLPDVPGVRVGDQLTDRLRQLARHHIGEGHLLQHLSQVGSDRDPDVAHGFGRPR